MFPKRLLTEIGCVCFSTALLLLILSPMFFLEDNDRLNCMPIREQVGHGDHSEYIVNATFKDGQTVICSSGQTEFNITKKNNSKYRVGSIYDCYAKPDDEGCYHLHWSPYRIPGIWRFFFVTLFILNLGLSLIIGLVVSGRIIYECYQRNQYQPLTYMDRDMVVFRR